MARSSTKKTKKTVTVNFEGVESGGRTVPDGWYRAEVKSVKQEEAESGNDMLVFQYNVSKGKLKALIYDNCVLLPQSLWRLKNALEAMGVEVPDGDLDIDLKELIGNELEVEILNEKYDGRDRSKIASFRALGSSEEEEETEEEEEEEEAPRKKKRKDADAEEEEEEEEPPRRKKKARDEEPEEEEEEEEEAPRKKKKRKDDEEEAEEEEEEEEDDAPKKKGKLRSGQKVKFKDGDGNWVKGVITSIDDDDIHVEDTDGDDWSLDKTEDEIVGL